MRTNKKALHTQRQIIDKKLKIWQKLRAEKRPNSGWLKAIRGALGLSARQLGELIQTDAASVIRTEEREIEGKVTLETLARAAKAMDCKLVYAIVPNDRAESLEAILQMRARAAAKEILTQVEHSMRLEDQGSEFSEFEVERLAQELKTKLDHKLWHTQRHRQTTAKKKAKSRSS